MLHRIIIIALFFLPLFSLAQRPLVAGWNENKVDKEKGTAVSYAPAMIRLPGDYFNAGSATKRYPLILMYHGMGQQGSDTVAVLSDGWPKNLSNNGSNAYIHEGGSVTVGNDAPVANDKNGNSREAIVVVAQRGYSPDPAWYAGMFEDITNRFRIDSSMVYLYGFSAGNWSATGVISNNSDTTYNRFVTALVINSGATQDLNWTGVRKIADRNIRALLVVGANDISYRDQMRRERDTINLYSNPDLALYEEVPGQGHSGFTGNAANSKTWTVTGGKNFVQWLFQYANPYATTWNPGNAAPTANAGNDQLISLPANQVTLNGSGTDPDGTISTYAWTKVSGPANYTIVSPSSASTNVTGLVQGVYFFRLTVTDNNSATGTDDVQITVNAAPTANAGNDQTITLPANQVTLNGSGTDPDGTISAYAWTKVSGPANYTIVSPSSASTNVTGLVQGVYVFRLTVTDNNNATGADDVQVTVNPAPPQGGSGDTINVNIFGGTNPYNNAAWNNWNVSSNLTSAAFTYSNGNNSGVTGSLQFSQGIGDNGATYGGTMCPPEVLRYTSYATSNRTLIINDLDATATYDFEFYASRANTGNATVFTIGSLSDTVVTDNNKTITANFFAIAPDANNKITINLARLNGTTYQYLNGFRIIKHSAGDPPVANAGSDVSTYMPKTFVQLNGSGSTGDITTVQWTKLSGGAHPQEGLISNPTSLNTTITNIGVGDYTYQLLVSNSSGSDRDTVVVHGLAQKSRTPNPNFEKFTLTPSGGEIYFPNIMTTYPTLNGGDTLVIGGNATGVVQLYGDDGSGGWGGDSLYPVVVINPPGQQIVIGGAFRINGQYIKVTGSGDPNIRYGFKLSGTAAAGIVLPAKHSNIEVERCYMFKGDIGIYAKSQIDSNNVLTYHPNWYFKNNWFHDNLLDSTGGEAMYLGHTFFFDGGQPASGYMPVKLDGLLIERDSVRWSGWDGIQTSNASNVTIRHNYVYETGRALQSSQLYGIILGGYSTGRVDSNEVYFARSSGIAIFGHDTVKVRGNKLDSCGYADIQIDGNPGSALPFTSIYIKDNQSSGFGAPSPPLTVVIDNNCIQRVSSYTAGAAIRSQNLNGTIAPGYIRNNTIGDALNRPVNNLIQSQTTGETITGNVLGSCGPLTIKVNVFGGTNPYNNAEWNDWNVSSNLTSSALDYSNGNSSPVTATLQFSQGIADNGSTYGGTMCPPEVLRYTSYATSNRTLTINNLDAASTYDLEFYASRANTGNATVFTIGSISDTVVTDNNKTVTANFSGIAPDGNNKIVINLARLNGTTYQYLNGFKIVKHNGPGGIRRPAEALLEESLITKPVLQIHPNPANNLLRLSYSSESMGKIQVSVYDGLGRIVRSQSFNKTQPVLQQQLNISSLGAGLYYIIVTGNDGKKMQSKFVKQ